MKKLVLGILAAFALSAAVPSLSADSDAGKAFAKGKKGGKKGGKSGDKKAERA